MELSEDLNEYSVHTQLIDPYLENDDKNEYALAQITCYNNKEKRIIGFAFTFILLFNESNDNKEENVCIDINQNGNEVSTETTPLITK